MVTNDTVTNDTDHHDPSIEEDRDIYRHNSGDNAVVPSTFSTNVKLSSELPVSLCSSCLILNVTWTNRDALHVSPDDRLGPQIDR